MTKFVCLILIALAAGAAERRAVFPPGAPKPVGPYSPGILAGDYVYVSGQGARGADGKYAESPEELVRQCLRNVESIVQGAGLTMEHVVFMQVYLHRKISYDMLNKPWREMFPKNGPARATLGVHLMPTDTPVEINAVAVRDLKNKQAVNPPGWTAGIPAGILTHDRLYLSGLVGWDPPTGKIPDSPEAQVQLSLDRIKSVLAAAKLDFGHLVFVNPYLTSKISTEVMNSIYSKYFEAGNAPARATIGVAWLPHDTNVEFSGVAVRDLRNRRTVRPRNMAPSRTASPCVWASETLYCSAKSGFIPGPNGGIYADRVEDQVRQTMRNLLDGLEEAGLDFSRVVASNVYLDQLDEFANMNGVYGKYFPAEAPPTRTTVAPLAPVTRGRTATGHYPKLEEISIVAVK